MAVIKYLDENNQIQELIFHMPMDAALSSESENGVQNKAVKAAIDSLYEIIDEIQLFD